MSLPCYSRLLLLLVCSLLLGAVEGTQLLGTDEGTQGEPSRVLFEEHFTNGFVGWRGKDGVPVHAKNATLMTGLACPNGVGTCMKFGGCTWQGGVFSITPVLCTLEQPCTVSFWHRGTVWQGFADGFAGRHLWTAVPSPDKGGGQIVSSSTSPGVWKQTVYQFPTAAQPNFVWDNDKPAAPGLKIVGPVHFMAEVYGEDPNCKNKDAFLADVRITRSRVSQQSPEVASVYNLKRKISWRMCITAAAVVAMVCILLTRLDKHILAKARSETEPLYAARGHSVRSNLQQYHSYA